MRVGYLLVLDKKSSNVVEMQIYAKWEASIHTGELLGRCVGVHHRDRRRFSGCCEGMKCVCGRQQLCLPASGVIL